VTALAQTNDCQRIIGGGSDGEIRLWHVGKQVQKLLMNQKLHNKAVTALTLLGNDDKLASSSLDGTIIIWNLTGSIPLTKMRVLSNSNSDQLPPVIGLSYCVTKNVLISCGGKDDRKLTFWDL
jgi:cilia- and flagella-associated protein 52